MKTDQKRFPEGWRSAPSGERSSQPLVLIGMGMLLVAVRALAGSWQFSAGPVYRGGMELSIRGSSYVQTLGLHAATPRHFSPDLNGWAPSPTICAPGSLADSGYADRSFDDGFVFMDPGTADPGSLEPGLTWYWGYQSDDQYNASTDTLIFHREGTLSGTRRFTSSEAGLSVSRQTLENGEINREQKVSTAGLEISGGYEVFAGPSLRAQVCIGLRGLWGVSERLQTSTYAEEIRVLRQEVRRTHLVTETCLYQDRYTYDTSGIIPPPAPYQGTYDGPGPVIPNTPASAEREVLGTFREISSLLETRRTGASRYTAANRLDIQIEADLYEFWLGPRLDWTLNSRLALFIVPALTFTYTDISVERKEQFLALFPNGLSRELNSWNDRRSAGEWHPGVAFALGADIRLVGDWHLGIQGGYEWLDAATRLDIGPNTVALNASGYSAGVLFSRQFSGLANRSSTALIPLVPEAVASKPPLESRSYTAEEIEEIYAPVYW